MNDARFPAPRMRAPVLAATLALALALLGAPPPAHAGLGGLVKAANDKAAQAATKRTGVAASPDCPPVEFTDEVAELTNDVLDRVLTGLQAASKATAGRGALLARKAKAQEQADALSSRYGDAIGQAKNKREAVERCIDEALGESRSQHQEEMRQKMMTDPATRARFIEFAQRQAQAQAAGDTAAASRLNRELLGLAAATHEDSLQARQKCGPVPALHPSGARLDSLQKETASIDEEVRTMDRNSIDEQAKAGGLEPAQFAMARERIEMYLAAVKTKPNPCGFTSAELKAVAAHRKALEAVLGA